jgi:hypothetical protein
LRAQPAKEPHGHQTSSAVPSKCTHHGSRLQDFDSEGLISEVEKRPELYKRRHQNTVTNTGTTGKSAKNHFYVHCNLFVETVEYSFIIFL